MDIIQLLLSIINDLNYEKRWLLSFICRYIPLKQWAYDETHSPKYQKFKTDELPKIEYLHHEWAWRLLIPYFEHRYNVKIKPIARRKECNIPDDCTCPFCNAPKPYLYSNNGDKGQILCKVCETTFSPQENRFSKLTTLRCPHCNHSLLQERP